MLDLLRELDRWWHDGERSVIARVVATDGSGPRESGAAMAVGESGAVVGSVSGGCVESAVVMEATDVLATGTPRTVTFGYSDDDAFAVGLTCGGTVHLFLEPWEPTPITGSLVDGLARRRPLALVTVVDGVGIGRSLLVSPEADVAPLGGLGDAELDRVVGRDALGELAAGTNAVRHYGRRGEFGEDAVTVFVESFAPPPRLVIFGAVDFTGALSRVAKFMGFHVTVCDAREVFATRQRFPEADDVVVDWPHRYLATVAGDLGPRDAICVLTHDTKFDVPAILAAFDTQVGYIGALGSRRTTADRRDQLVAAGATEASLARLYAPIGLDLGGRSPEEAAVSIAAEIIAQRNGRSAASLRNTGGPIHR